MKINVKLVQNNLVCYNPTTRVPVTSTISRIGWSHNLTSPTFTKLWTITDGNYTILQNSGVSNTNYANTVTVTVYYDLVKIVKSFINVTYSSV